MPINLRSDGYPAYLLPGQVLLKLMLRDLQRHAPAGRYVCLYDGDGVISFQFDAKVTLVGKGRVEFDFTPTWLDGCYAAYCSDNGIALVLQSTNPYGQSGTQYPSDHARVRVHVREESLSSLVSKEHRPLLCVALYELANKW
jgi:hypothetical protein